ncbi:solute carrier family 23 member 1-like isoform X2 [Mizuhopecten yessoensis]|uniref:Solute carrier family 23 member 2 n=1 Tax=Mizuhopecten yessoensis TaxID=6573 RepID=A0A210PY56_MIZYE|nr:solute carrier family 23 member 1-like isoform X2 [Mizuhopecten yessoensis]OWF41416.1 Solute carrier family 23 member 2 [Mizuhopecten yessoensis]
MSSVPRNIVLTAMQFKKQDDQSEKINDHGITNAAFSADTPVPQVKGYDTFTTKEQESESNDDRKDSLKGTNTSPLVLRGLQYKVDDNPPWHTTILLGFQHYLMLLSSNLATPAIFATIMCAAGNKQVTSTLLGNMLFACGIGTVLQTLFGTRLPIVQCPAFAYVVPMLAMIEIEEFACPDFSVVANATAGEVSGLSEDEYWKTRLNMLAGSGMVAAGVEIIIGASGIINILLRYIGPLTVAPTIMMIGLGVTKLGFNLAGKHWGISLGTIILIIVLSECIPKFSVNVACSCTKCPAKTDVVFHKMFSVIISVCVMWLLCYILTITDVFPVDKTAYGYDARTDLRTEILHESPWFSFPYPGKFGLPVFNTSMFVGMIAGVLTSIIESIGDYYTCARMAGAVPPPPSAVNRGILLEGIDCILSILVGSGFGVTSCSQNIGVISLTKVGSRRVVLVAGMMMMFFGCFSKMSAFVVTVPDPIIGAAFIVLFAVLTAVGGSNLQYADLNSPRNMIVMGMALFVGLALPPWLTDNQNLFLQLDSGLRQVITALLGNNIFMACFTALILDNLMPGTVEERGLIAWRQVFEDSGSDVDGTTNAMTLKTYDLPFGMSYIRKWKWTYYIPFSPTFSRNGLCCSAKK